MHRVDWNELKQGQVETVTISFRGENAWIFHLQPKGCLKSFVFQIIKLHNFFNICSRGIRDEPFNIYRRGTKK